MFLGVLATSIGFRRHGPPPEPPAGNSIPYASGVPWRGINRPGAEYGNDWDAWLGPYFHVWPGDNDSTDGEDPDWVAKWGVELNYNAAKGFNFIRVPISWERIQHTLNGPLATTYANKLVAVVTQATARGFRVLVDLHNYARYATGSHDASGNEITGHTQRIMGDGTLAYSHLADVWAKIAALFLDDPDVEFDLMNEPHDFVGDSTSFVTGMNAVIAAIRATGSTHRVQVPNTHGSDINHFFEYSPQGGPQDEVAMLGIVDSANNYCQGIHAYWVPAPDELADHWTTKMGELITWARANGQKLFLNEFGTKTEFAADGAADQVSDLLDLLNANSDVVVGWCTWNLPDWQLISDHDDDGVRDNDVTQMAWYAGHLTPNFLG